MRTFALMALLSAGVVQACGQTGAGQAFLPAVPLVQGQPAVRDSRLQTPAVGTVGRVQAPGVRMLAVDRKQIVVPPKRKSETCYAIRSYNFAPSTPGSDETTYQDSTTCQVASNAQMKGARLMLLGAGQK